MPDVLGLPLDAALARLRAAGIEPRVVCAQAPRNPRETGTLRVIRLRGEELTVAWFLDGEPDT